MRIHDQILTPLLHIQIWPQERTPAADVKVYHINFALGRKTV